MTTWLRPDLIFEDERLCVTQQYARVDDALYKLLALRQTRFGTTTIQVKLHRLEPAHDWATVLETNWLPEAFGEEILGDIRYGEHPEDALVLFAL